MASDRQIDIIKQGWEDLANGNMDALAAGYAEEMIFVLPGQNDVLEGRAAFRAALDNLGAALPPGFQVTGLRYCTGENEVVNIVEFTADKLPEGSSAAVTFRFGAGDKIVEERWFIDTEQWKSAF